MNNILIKVNSTLLSISLVNKKDNKNINNTNIIDTKELLFSKSYIEDNLELVGSFINTIIIKNKIDKVRVNNIEITKLALDIISYSKQIKKLLINDDKPINYEIFLKLLDNNSLEYINCYDIPPYLLERLDTNKDLKVDIRSEMFFMSKFMEDNKLYKYSDIYYKKNIVINKNFNKQELDDFRTFININKHLKEIHIKNYTNDLIFSIIDIFDEYNINDKIIVFYENNNINVIVNSINYLKGIYKDFLDTHKILFKIVYSKEYKRKNLFKQLNFVTLKYTFFCLLIGALLFAGLDYYKNYTSEKSVDKINNKLTDIMEQLDFIDEEQTNDVEYIDTVENESNVSYSSGPSSYYTKYEQIFDQLSEINNDTVGWITVNNTKINYPVVQGTDNEYYLNNDFNKQKNIYGWIFMDYRNNIYNLSDNTIIWGHNIRNGMMFGTLRYATNESWYKNSDNQIITFNTKVKNMKWRIFSIYRIPVTNDYLYANFGEDEEFEDFIDMIQSRSIYDFGVEVTSKDHILTLSTCSIPNTYRLVVHAVLIDE